MTPDQVPELRELIAAAAGFALGALTMLGASWRRARMPQDARGARPATPDELEALELRRGGPASW